MTIDIVLQQLGLSNKEINVYLSCLKLGPSPVRRLAEDAGINRGTTYDILKSLIAQGLVAYFQQEKKQYFVAEDPEKLKEALTAKEKELVKTREKISQIIPELKSIYNNAGAKPVSRFYEGTRGIQNILEDVLNSVVQSSAQEYLVYSSSDIKEYIYKNFPDFTQERVKKNIKVRVIALGAGKMEKEIALAERKILSQEKASPTYIIIYQQKTAFISLDTQKKLVGVIVEDEGLAQTQKMIFEFVWAKL